ncbi:MAG: ThiF family adenylyltransferase [Synergistaceae bacterium]
MESKIENIVICGIGAAGANVFMNLLYAYPNINFTVVDFDKIEDRNVSPGTQPYTKTDINRPKTQALQRIAQQSKQKRIEVVNKKLTSVKDIQDLVKDPATTLIIDAFDNAESRNLFLKLAKKYNVLHVGFSAVLTGEAAWNEIYEPMTASKADGDIDVCEMAIARPFIMALTGMASIVISQFVENGTKINMYFDKSLNIKRF